MKLIEIDNGRIGHYFGDDTSKEAIDGFVAKCGGRTWRDITPSEAAAIIAARPRPKPVMPSLPANADAGMMEALGVLVDAVERLDAKNRELAAKLESVIDVTHTTDVRGE